MTAETHVERRTLSVHWGKHRENGIWLAPVSQWRVLWRGHDALYVAAGRLRSRVMKP